MAYPRHPVDPRHPVPVPAVPTSSLRRYRAQILDPHRSASTPQRRPNPAAYVKDQLLVQGSGGGPAIEALLAAAKETGHDIGASTSSRTKREKYVSQLGKRAIKDLTARTWVTRMHLQATPGSDAAPDAWSVLQRFREIAGDPSQDGQFGVGLNHLVTLTAGVGISGVPYIDGPAMHGAAPYIDGPAFGTPYIDGPAFGTPYIDGPGVGGRLPVTWLGSPPSPPVATTRGRRPVVAVLDTGLGRNEWLTDPDAVLGATVLGEQIGLGPDVPDAEVTGSVVDPRLGTLDRDAGHGTFIAGIVRQTCPDARVLAIRVMPSDGVVDEHQLIIALNKLLVRHAIAQSAKNADDIIDVLSLSLGYYREDPDDVAYTGVLARTLQSFAELGVAVVTAAGNDRTTTPMFPAGLASRRKGADVPATSVPLVSVGALNPSGTKALFSNDGPWVSAWRPGANVVSTLPTTFDGSAQPVVVTQAGAESLDPDDYQGGFGVWSGTSFAAPVLAGEIAADLVQQGSLQVLTPASMVRRGRKAVTNTVGWTLS